MDTNLTLILIKALTDQKTSSPHDGNQLIVLVIGMIIAAVAPTLAAIAAYYKARASEANTAEIKKEAINTTESVKEIHIAVNSERSAMLMEVKNLRDEILRISKNNSTLVEEKVGTDKAAALALPAGLSQAQLAQVLEAIKSSNAGGHGS